MTSPEAKRFPHVRSPSFGTAPDYGGNILGVKTWGMALSTLWWGFAALGQEFL
jgi:hypothetical protein